jgi:hypothetical protein
MGALAELRTRGLRLDVVGESLIVEPSSALTDELRECIRSHKPELLEELHREIAAGTDAAREDRLQRVTQQLRKHAKDRLAFEVNEGDPVLVTLAIRAGESIAAAEYEIQRDRWDRTLFIKTITETAEKPL